MNPQQQQQQYAAPQPDNYQQFQNRTYTQDPSLAQQLQNLQLKDRQNSEKETYHIAGIQILERFADKLFDLLGKDVLKKVVNDNSIDLQFWQNEMKGLVPQFQKFRDELHQLNIDVKSKDFQPCLQILDQMIQLFKDQDLAFKPNTQFAQKVEHFNAKLGQLQEGVILNINKFV
jgi:hypothetical protein